MDSLSGTPPRRDHHPFRWKPALISVLVWVRSFIEPDVLKTMYRSTYFFFHYGTVRQYRSDLSDQPALEIRVRI